MQASRFIPLSAILAVACLGAQPAAAVPAVFIDDLADGPPIVSFSVPPPVNSAQSFNESVTITLPALTPAGAVIPAFSPQVFALTEPPPGAAGGFSDFVVESGNGQQITISLFSDSLAFAGREIGLNDPLGLIVGRAEETGTFQLIPLILSQAGDLDVFVRSDAGSEVPEPASAALLAAALGGLWLACAWRKGRA